MIENKKISLGEDIDESAFEQILKFIRLRVTDVYAYPPEIVQVDGITIATLGNFSASTGKPKSKKTFNVSAIVASALSGKEVLRYKATLPNEKHKVLYIDTEQSKCHCHKVLERILVLAGMPIDLENERLEFYMLREYSPKHRRQIINLALETDPNIGFVVIDGIRDLMYDINNPSESVELINDLMRWSSMHDLHIHTVLHLNKGCITVEADLKNQAERDLKRLKQNKFSGGITLFGIPRVRHGMVLELESELSPEMNGSYYIEKVTKDFNDDATYRQKIELGGKAG